MSVVWSMKLFKEKTPPNIVDYAEAHPKSELHKCFTWDDTKAANEWRKFEARQVVRLLVAEAYKPVTQIVRNEDEYKELLKRAKAELASFKERYKTLVELESVLEAIDALL